MVYVRKTAVKIVNNDEKDKKIAELEKELKLLREMIDVIKSLGRGK